ncbi:hypothetical protein SprV_0100262500 [Sparganum proliferum]
MRPQGKRPPGKLNIALSPLPAYYLHFSDELTQRLDNLPVAAAAAAAIGENACVENRWCHLRDTVQSTALPVLGRARRQHQDWFDDNYTAISNLLVENDSLHKAYVTRPTDDNRAAFYRSRRLVQQRFREMQDTWTVHKAKEAQGYADRNEWKNFFSAIRAIDGPPTKATAPLLGADGSTLLIEMTQVLQPWAEHFKGVLNRPCTISDAAIARLSQVETSADLDHPPSLHQGRAAAPQRESARIGRDPSRIYKHDDPRSNRPERSTALVARELARYKVDIAALSETQFSEQGQLEEVGAGYTFFWSGRPRTERRNAGVAFAIRNDIVG